MSGVFGVIDIRKSIDVVQTITLMAERMAHRDWYQCDTWHETATNVALGRLGIGVLNAERQPALSVDGQIALFMAGEFFEWSGEPEATHLKRRAATHDAEHALGLYKTYGPGFTRYLSGSFIISIYDRPRQLVLLASCRFGMYPTYVYRRAGFMVFAPELKGVLCAPGVARQLDEIALAQYMRFQQLLGARTFLQDVQLLPHASTLTFNLRTGETELTPYWSFADVPAEQSRLGFREVVHETARLFSQSIKRRLRDRHRFGVYLSGGLDSRMILAARSVDQPRLTTLTYGLKDCRDVYYAAKVAARAGANHHFCEFSDGKWVKDFADLHLKLTEGFHSWVHMHGMSTLPLARSQFDINLSGFAGDSTLGGTAIEPRLNHVHDELAVLALSPAIYNQEYNWPGLTEAEEYLLYAPKQQARLRGLAFESYRQELKPYLFYAPHRRMDYFDLIQSAVRHFSYSVVFSRSHLDVRCPYLDYDLLDFIWSIPLQFRADRRLSKSLLSLLSPELAMIPHDKDEFLPIDNMLIYRGHALMQRAKRRINRHIYPAFREHFTLHSDYEGWLRTDLRQWAEAVLFSSRKFEFGQLNPDFVHSLWQRHLSGQEQWMLGKIAPIMSFEMLLESLF